MQGTVCMLRPIKKSESILIKDDPVRPHFSYEWRTTSGREIWVLSNDETDDIDAIICVAYTNKVPSSEQDLEFLSQAAYQDGQEGSIAVFYTVWSYSSGSGRKLVNSLAYHIAKTNPKIKRWVTLSPLTVMAEKFHLSNGAIFLEKHEDCQNFDYTHAVLEMHRVKV